jgi:hypothetical protein
MNRGTALAQLDRVSASPGTPFVSVHIADFASLAGMTTWRLQAPRFLASCKGLRFAKLMSSFGSRRSAGFSAGLPSLTRVVLVLVWETEDALDSFLERSPLAQLIGKRCRYAWLVRAVPLAARGSFRGRSPLSEMPRSAPGQNTGHFGPLAALTLGRTSLWSMARFASISPSAAPFLETTGLITAVSAGFPATGNATFTLWESEEAMLRFAYRRPPGDHRETIRQNRRGSVLRAAHGALPAAADRGILEFPPTERRQACAPGLRAGWPSRLHERVGQAQFQPVKVKVALGNSPPTVASSS